MQWPFDQMLLKVSQERLDLSIVTPCRGGEPKIHSTPWPIAHSSLVGVEAWHPSVGVHVPLPPTTLV